LTWADHCYDLASFASASSSPGSVQVILVVIWWINVNYQADTINVNTASSNVSCNQYVRQALFKSVQSAGTNSLGFPTMQCASWHTFVSKVLGDAIYASLGTSKEHGLTLAGTNLGQDRRLVFTICDE
jgi:hypothetical protein